MVVQLTSKIERLKGSNRDVRKTVQTIIKPLLSGHPDQSITATFRFQRLLSQRILYRIKFFAKEFAADKRL